MAGNNYRISCSLYGHKADVRCLSVTEDGRIISGSRDLSAGLWDKNESVGYYQVATYTCHTNFVASVCALGPTEEHPAGVIVTGSNDKTIRLFEPLVTTPFQVLGGHTNTVCKLSPGLVKFTLLSASWDQTARGWMENGGKWTHVQFSGHSAAVWSICQLNSGLVVTASADKTLRVFEDRGNFLRDLKGHTDCVRDVTSFRSDEILSVANDAAVRHWNVLSGECLNTYHGHGHYIYSIATLGNGGWVTSSEDGTVKVWDASGQIDSISLPSASVWAVATLPDEDIVTGSNDGVVRVFTKNPSRVADSQSQAIYESEVAAFLEKASQAVGGVKLSELPGKEALFEPGRTDGQTKMIRDGNKAMAYAWSSSEGTWQLIGDVVGAAGEKSESGRPVFNGKEYDYVFNVDIEDGKPALKLPYNKSEDPWVSAQKFIHDNDLPQSYLEQVANFIVSNSGPTQAQIQPDFVDPFTGSTRYVPQPTGDPSRQEQRPFNSTASKYFPQREFLRFDQANTTAIKDKLLLINRERGFNNNEDEIIDLINTCAQNEICSSKVLTTLDCLLTWPNDCLLPVLDITRLLIRNQAVNRHLCTDDLLTRLQPLLKESPNNMLVLRIVANMMVGQSGEGLASKHRLKLIEFVLSVPLPYSKFVQVALATLMLNLSVLLRRSETPDGRVEVLMAMQELLPSFSENEAVFRSLVALGTLLTDTADRPKEVEPFLPFLQLYSGEKEARIRECADDILAVTR